MKRKTLHPQSKFSLLFFSVFQKSFPEEIPEEIPKEIVKEIVKEIPGESPEKKLWLKKRLFFTTKKKAFLSVQNTL